MSRGLLHSPANFFEQVRSPPAIGRHFQIRQGIDLHVPASLRHIGIQRHRIGSRLKNAPEMRTGPPIRRYPSPLLQQPTPRSTGSTSSSAGACAGLAPTDPRGQIHPQKKRPRNIVGRNTTGLHSNRDRAHGSPARSTRPPADQAETRVQPDTEDELRLRRTIGMHGTPCARAGTETAKRKQPAKTGAVWSVSKNPR
jgi:hypothetical protein